MNEEELKRLIGKYYDGESTEEEESTLRSFFRKGDIPRGYEAEKIIFSYYDDSSYVPEPSVDFEARIMAGIDASERKVGSKNSNRYLIPFMSAAAGIILLIGSYFLLFKKAESTDTFTDPELAYTETIKILRDVSSQMNQGAQVLEPVGKMSEVTRKSFESINKSAGLVEKNLMNLNYLQKAIDLSHFPVDKNINK